MREAVKKMQIQMKASFLDLIEYLMMLLQDRK